jgi:2-polyprenyl-3-methyl-5-hydroxy-6-metoxy-1,4-benzoquinol methylase
MNKTERFWDKLSKSYDRRAGKYEKTTLRTIENSKKHLRDSDILLDCGCATGSITLDLAPHVKKIHGIDISSKMIEAAKNKAKQRNAENIHFTKSSIFDEQFARGTFDVIVAFNVLLYFSHVQEAIQRMNELLKPGGLLICATACLAEKRTFLNVLSGAMIFVSVKAGILPALQYFKIPELEKSVKRNNFELVETEILCSNPAIEYFIVANKM